MPRFLRAGSGDAAAGYADASGRRRQVAAVLATVLGGWLATVLAAPARAFEVSAQPPAGAVRTQPDPFLTLHTLDEARIASIWSSVPAATGCTDADRSLAGHAQMLAGSSGGTGAQGMGSFDLLQPRYRLQADATVQRGCVIGQLALQRRTAAGGDEWTWDGTALTWRIDPHWRVAAGTIAHQWGPAWDGSLILGTSSQPFVNAALLAQTGSLAESKLWWWLGELEFSAFFGQLENHRTDFDRPYLMGARLVLRPIPSLQLGLSRTAQWGGEGRDNSWQAFWRSLVGHDNQDGADGVDEQPGNQLGGFDVRWDLSRWLQWCRRSTGR